MATTKHPLTGVELNRITIKRPRLSESDAVTAHIMRHEGATFTDIVQRLGTNANRIGEVFRGELHPQSAKLALEILMR